VHCPALLYLELFSLYLPQRGRDEPLDSVRYLKSLLHLTWYN